MRMRKKKHSAERIEACAPLLLRLAPDDKAFSEKTAAEVSCAIFGRELPLELEIGCGKGDFAVGVSAARPQSGIIALERVADVAVTALEKAVAAADTRPDNLRFIIGNAQSLEGWFPDNTFSRIYINFCDPWPKKGYAKRRPFLSFTAGCSCRAASFTSRPTTKGCSIGRLSSSVRRGLRYRRSRAICTPLSLPRAT